MALEFTVLTTCTALCVGPREKQVRKICSCSFGVFRETLCSEFLLLQLLDSCSKSSFFSPLLSGLLRSKRGHSKRTQRIPSGTANLPTQIRVNKGKINLGTVIERFATREEMVLQKIERRKWKRFSMFLPLQLIIPDGTVGKPAANRFSGQVTGSGWESGHPLPLQLCLLLTHHWSVSQNILEREGLLRVSTTAPGDQDSQVKLFPQVKGKSLWKAYQSLSDVLQQSYMKMGSSEHFLKIRALLSTGSQLITV